MKKKIIIILVCILMATSGLTILTPNETQVEAASNNGENFGLVGLDYNYIFQTTKQLTDIIFNASLTHNGIYMGRYFATEGEQTAASWIEERWLPQITDNLSQITDVTIEHEQITLKKKIDVLSYGLKLYDETHTVIIPNNESFPIVRRWFTEENPKNFSYTNVDVIPFNQLKLFPNTLCNVTYTRINNSNLGIYGEIVYIANYSNVTENETTSEKIHLINVTDNEYNDTLEFIANNLSGMGFILMRDNVSNISDWEIPIPGVAVSKENASIIKNLVINESQVVTAETPYDSEDPIPEIGVLTICNTSINLSDRPDDYLILANESTCNWFGRLEMRRPHCVGLLQYDPTADEDVHFMYGPHLLEMLMSDWILRAEDYSSYPKSIITLARRIVDTNRIELDLNEWISGHDVKADFWVNEKKMNDAESNNIICTVKGKDSSKKVIISGGHYEGLWGQCASDNAVNIGIMMGILKYFNDNRIIPKYDTIFIAFGAHEDGLRGSRSYVLTHYNIGPANDIEIMISPDVIAHNITNSTLYIKSGYRNNPLLRLRNQCIVEKIIERTKYDQIFSEEDYNIRVSSVDRLIKIVKFWPFWWRQDVFANTIPGYDGKPFWLRNAPVIFFGKYPSGNSYHHQVGLNHTKGDVLSTLDRYDINVTADLMWNISRFYAVDSNCWFESTFYQLIDVPYDDDILNDTVNVSFTIGESAPQDWVTVSASLILVRNPLRRYTVEKHYIVTPEGIEDTLSLKLPKWMPPGYYFIRVNLYNSTGEVRNLLDLGFFANDTYKSEGLFYLYPSNGVPSKPDTPTGPTNIEAGMSYEYDTSSTDPEGEHIWYLWNWRANKIIPDYSFFGPCLSGVTHTMEHYWIGNQENVDIKVKARDCRLNPFIWSEWSDPLTVTVEKGCAINTASTTVLLNQEIEFEGLQYGFSGLRGENWCWELGDGCEESEQNITHMYNVTGNYTVNLTITQYGESVNYSVIVTVTNLISDFNLSSSATNPYEILVFNDTSTGINQIYSWSWDFGDGNTSSNRNVSHSYTLPGVYTVWLNVSDDQQNISSYFHGICIESVPPEIVYVYNTPNATDYDGLMTIYADVFDEDSGVNNVKINITSPDDFAGNYTMEYNSSNIFPYSYVFSNTSQKGQYRYTIWVDDYAGNINSSTGYYFNVPYFFGYVKPGCLNQSLDDRITGTVFTSHECSTADNITAYIYGSENQPGPNYKCMMYRYNDSELIGTTEEKSPTVTGWITFSFSSPKPVLERDTQYVITVWGNNSSSLYYDNDSDVYGMGGCYDTEIFGIPPDPIAFVSIAEPRVYSVYCSYTNDTTPPQITNVTENPHIVGFGSNITISASITDAVSGVNTVNVNITYPDQTRENYTMSHTTGNTYQYVFADTWLTGQYNYTTWATDNSNNTNCSNAHHVHVSAQATISIATLKNSYSGTQYINITDPPNPPENYTLVGRGLTWDEYYNADTGQNILEVSAEPINYQENNGTWMPINKSISQLASNHPAYVYGYRKGNDQGLYGAFFKSNAQNNWPVAFTYNRSTDPTIHVVRSKLVGVGYLDPGNNWSYQYLQNVQNSQGQVNGNSILYENVFTGTDVIYSYENTRLKENIILSNTTKTVLQNHPPSLYGCSNNSFLVFITKLDYQNLQPYNASTPITGNLTVSEGQMDFRDAAGMLRCSLPIGEAYELMNDSSRHQLVYRIIQYNGNYFLLSGLRVTDLMEMTFPVVIDPTQEQTTWLSITNDGFIYKSSSTSYNTAWSAGTGTISSSVDYITIGQNKGSSFPNPTYYVYRGFLFFNTSTLPSNAYIDNATLSLYKKGDNSTTDFTITVQNGQPTYPHNPLQFGDYNKNYYSGNGGGLSTTNFVNGRNNITLTNHSWIQKSGMTKFCIRSSHDINGTPPTGKEYVDVYSREKGTSYAPRLIIHYRNQSKIKNTGSTDIDGYLLIQVQFYNSTQGKWLVDNDTINETSPRTITSGDQLALDTIFNGLVRASDLTHGTGTYRVYTAFRDPEGNILRTNDGAELKTWWQFSKT